GIWWYSWHSGTLNPVSKTACDLRGSRNGGCAGASRGGEIEGSPPPRGGVTAGPPVRLPPRADRISAEGPPPLCGSRLPTWEFGFNSNVRRAGVCFYPHAAEPGRIELSVHFAASNLDEEVTDTLLHEIAHALVGPGHGHDEVWRAKCREIGARPEACYG